MLTLFHVTVHLLYGRTEHCSLHWGADTKVRGLHCDGEYSTHCTVHGAQTVTEE